MHRVPTSFGPRAVASLLALGLLAGAAPADDRVIMGRGAFNPPLSDWDATWFEYRLDERSRFFKWGKPLFGFLKTDDGVDYLFFGAYRERKLADRLYLSASTGVGKYHEIPTKRLGKSTEFRSSLDLAFDVGKGVRLGMSILHTSNAGLGDFNPGANSVFLTLSVPIRGTRGRPTDRRKAREAAAAAQLGTPSVDPMLARFAEDAQAEAKPVRTEDGWSRFEGEDKDVEVLPPEIRDPNLGADGMYADPDPVAPLSVWDRVESIRARVEAREAAAAPPTEPPPPAPVEPAPEPESTELGDDALYLREARAPSSSIFDRIEALRARVENRTDSADGDA